MVHRESIKVSEGCGVEPQEVAEGGEGESQPAEVQTLPSSFLSSVFYIGVVKKKKNCNSLVWWKFVVKANPSFTCWLCAYWVCDFGPV